MLLVSEGPEPKADPGGFDPKALGAVGDLDPNADCPNPPPPPCPPPSGVALLDVREGAELPKADLEGWEPNADCPKPPPAPLPDPRGVALLFEPKADTAGLEPNADCPNPPPPRGVVLLELREGAELPKADPVGLDPKADVVAVG